MCQSLVRSSFNGYSSGVSVVNLFLPPTHPLGTLFANYRVLCVFRSTNSNKDFLAKKKSSALSEITQWQCSYDFQVDPDIQQYIEESLALDDNIRHARLCVIDWREKQSEKQNQKQSWRCFSKRCGFRWIGCRR